MKAPALHPLAVTHLREMKERWGVDLTPAEIVWIVKLCDRVINPADVERAALCGIPVQAGISDVWLWPFTVGAAIWFNDYALKWWGRNRRNTFMAVAYALANGRSPEVMRRVMRGKFGAWIQVRLWALSLPCTLKELEEAVDIALPSVITDPTKQQKVNDRRGLDWNRVVGELEAATGIRRDYFVWDISKEETLKAWDRARSVAAARGLCDGENDQETRALCNLAYAKAHIIKSREKDNQDESA